MDERVASRRRSRAARSSTAPMVAWPRATAAGRPPVARPRTAAGGGARLAAMTRRLDQRREQVRPGPAGRRRRRRRPSCAAARMGSGRRRPSPPSSAAVDDRPGDERVGARRRSVAPASAARAPRLRSADRDRQRSPADGRAARRGRHGPSVVAGTSAPARTGSVLAEASTAPAEVRSDSDRRTAGRPADRRPASHRPAGRTSRPRRAGARHRARARPRPRPTAGRAPLIGATPVATGERLQPAAGAGGRLAHADSSPDMYSRPNRPIGRTSMRSMSAVRSASLAACRM